MELASKGAKEERCCIERMHELLQNLQHAERGKLEGDEEKRRKKSGGDLRMPERGLDALRHASIDEQREGQLRHLNSGGGEGSSQTRDSESCGSDELYEQMSKLKIVGEILRFSWFVLTIIFVAICARLLETLESPFRQHVQLPGFAVLPPSTPLP